MANLPPIKMPYNDDARRGVEERGNSWKGSKIDSSGIQLNYIGVYRHNQNFTLIIYIHLKPFSVILTTFGQKSTLQKSMFQTPERTARPTIL